MTKINLLLFQILISISVSAQYQIKKERKLELQLDDMVLVENNLSVHPLNDQHLFLAGMYINPNDDSDYGVFGSTSLDGGQSWSKPFKTGKSEGADPWGLITKYGTTILADLGLSDLILYISRDNGKTWVSDSLQMEDGFDHETMVYDLKKERIYLVADHNNKVYFNYSSDDGQTFLNAKESKINNLLCNTMNGQISTDHSLLIPFSNYAKPIYDEELGKTRFRSMDRSINYLIEVDEEGNMGVPQLICDECEKGFPVLAVDHSNSPYRGNLYYVCSNQSRNEILFMYSPNKGKSWTPPKVIKIYHTLERTKRNPFTGMPQVAVNNQGVVGLIWQDRTQDREGLCNRLYFAASTDGGKSFMDPMPISSVASCMETAANSWGGKRYKSGGDYTGMITNKKGEFIVIWPDSRNGIAQYFSATISIQ